MSKDITISCILNITKDCYICYEDKQNTNAKSNYVWGHITKVSVDTWVFLLIMYRQAKTYSILSADLSEELTKEQSC